MQKIILVGGGGHCKSCIEVLESTQSYEIVGIIDRPEQVGEYVLGYPTIGCDDDTPKFLDACQNFLITVGQIKSVDLRKSLYERIVALGGHFPTIISPRAYVSQHATLAQGTIVLHGALVNANAQIGENCIINSKSNIEHDAVVGDYCHISTGAFVNGNCTIGQRCFIGSCAVVSSQVNITNDVVVGAGCVVVRDITVPGTYVGNPQRKVK